MNARLRRHLLVLCLLMIAGPAVASEGKNRTEVQLEGLAVLSAETFSPGPDSGQFIEASNGIATPFIGQQPVQGFSGLVRQGSRWLALSDNGFGSRANSPDVLLAAVFLTPDFNARLLVATPAFTLSDPGRHLRFPIIANHSHYPGSRIPVAPEIRAKRLLTGADLDPESIAVDSQGDIWIGDEFGPFLVRINSLGEVLEPPFPLPGVFAPNNPYRGNIPANAQGSGGFEGLTISRDGRYLFTMLEKALTGDDPLQLPVYRFDLESRQFDPPEAAWHYRLNNSEHRIGDLLALADGNFLVIERDRLEGTDARFKRIIKVTAIGQQSTLIDLLAIPDPNEIGGDYTVNGEFRFPFVTIEGLAIVDNDTLAVINDNNFPFSTGRHQAAGRPDDSELIFIHVPDGIQSSNP